METKFKSKKYTNHFLLLGIDIGTTSVKAVLFNEEGLEIGSHIEDYNLLTPEPGIVELDPEIYWNSTVLCIRNILNKLQKDLYLKIKA